MEHTKRIHFPCRRKQQRQQLEPPRIPTHDLRTFEPTSESKQPERNPTSRSSLRRHTFAHAHTHTPPTTPTYTYPQTYPRPRARSRTSPNSTAHVKFGTESTIAPQPPHNTTATATAPVPLFRHHPHQNMDTTTTTTEHRDHRDRGLRTWWQQFTAAQKMRPSPPQHSHSYPSHPRSHTQAQAQTAAPPPAGPVFGRPLKESLKCANVQISTADANGKLYVWGYIPVVVAKWCVLFSSTLCWPLWFTDVVPSPAAYVVVCS